MLDEMVVIRPATQKLLDRLNDIPVDIEPQFVTAEEIAPPAAVLKLDRPARPARH